MLRAGRFEKTPERNLADLDDHLYLLEEDFAKVIGGDPAHVKRIAASLRTLICESARTEGLLWRVAEQIGADVTIDLQTTRGINRENPIAQGMSLALIPVFRTGSGPAAFAANHISLKVFIKEYEALYHNGASYTHEKLISSIAQQMGISHESEDVEPHLIELSGMAMADRSALIDFLLKDTSFTLEVGKRVLEFAASKSKFQRRARPTIVIPNRPTDSFSFIESDHFLGRNKKRPVQGTKVLIFRPPNPGWETDNRSYNFGTSTSGDLTTTVVKHRDGTLEVIAYGLTPKIRLKRSTIVSRAKPEIVVILRWSEENFHIMIDGNLG